MSHSRLVMTSQKSDIHYTPAEVLDLVHQFWPQGIDLDPASDEAANQLVKAKRFFDQVDNGLIQQWVAHRIFMNPPYSQVRQFVDHLCYCRSCGMFGAAISLTKADTSTRWFRSIWENASAVCFVDHRLRFGEAAQSAPFASALSYFGPESERFAAMFRALGPVVARLE